MDPKFQMEPKEFKNEVQTDDPTSHFTFSPLTEIPCKCTVSKNAYICQTQHLAYQTRFFVEHISHPH